MLVLTLVPLLNCRKGAGGGGGSLVNLGKLAPHPGITVHSSLGSPAVNPLVELLFQPAFPKLTCVLDWLDWTQARPDLRKLNQ